MYAGLPNLTIEKPVYTFQNLTHSGLLDSCTQHLMALVNPDMIEAATLVAAILSFTALLSPWIQRKIEKAGIDEQITGYILVILFAWNSFIYTVIQYLQYARC